MGTSLQPMEPAARLGLSRSFNGAPIFTYASPLCATANGKADDEVVRRVGLRSLVILLFTVVEEMKASPSRP